MIIDCPCGLKKFNVLDSQIPDKGRMVKCGTCGVEWFFKINEKDELSKKKFVKVHNDISFENTIDNQADENIIKNNYEEDITTNFENEEIKLKTNPNYLKIFIVLVISIIALIIFIDTFKKPISLVIPGVETYLQNLYFSLIDLKLFIKDLIK